MVITWECEDDHMKHKGLIALAAIFAAGIVLTTFTSQILGVKEPVGTVMITNEADTEGVPMAGRVESSFRGM